MEGDGGGGKKGFRQKKSGKKVKKKEAKDGKERHNRKAFTFSGGSKSVQRKVQQSADQNARKTHAPILDKTPDVAPPYVVVVQGPRGCGKTTLIRSLVKHYTKQNIQTTNGPITVVTSKHRRLTIYECPADDIAGMMDLAKIADLALCMIDASVGLEMATFEWINLLQNFGFPKVMGVLTHLDKFPETKTIRKKKKEFKQRFWAEIYDGAKLFYFSGVQYGVRYLKTEVANLARFIAVQKVPLLTWRQAHPYVCCLRFEDQTADHEVVEEQMLSREGNNMFRKLHLYGYCYGARMRAGQFVHLCGVGDFPISSIEQYTDPCPSPIALEAAANALKSNVSSSALSAAAGGVNLRKKKVNNLRTLQEKHKAIYAPGCDIGNVLMDKDAVYINLPKHQVGFTPQEGEGIMDDADKPEAVRLVRELQEKVGGLNDRATGSGNALRLTGKSKRVLANGGDARRMAPGGQLGGEGEGESSDEGESEVDEGDEEISALDAESEEEGGRANREEEDDDMGRENRARKGKKRVNSDSEDDGSDSEEDEENELLQHKREFFAEAKKRFARDIPLEELVYGTGAAASSSSSSRAAGPSANERSKRTVDFQSRSELIDTSAGDAGASSGPKKLSLFGDDDSDDEPEGEALRGASASSTSGPRPASAVVDNGFDCWRVRSLPFDGRWLYDEEAKAELKRTKFVTGDWDSETKKRGTAGSDDDDEGSEDDASDIEEDVDESQLSADQIRERKEKIMRKRLEKEDKEKNKTEGEDEFGRRNQVKRLNLDDMLHHDDALPIGSYVRLVIENVPKLSVDALSLSKPLIVGGLLPGELKMGVMQLRVKNHRWAPRVLKSNDPILASIGWRRFQTLPIYSLEDRNEKRIMRFLKYTPEHMHCQMTFYAPLHPPKTGCVLVKNMKNIANYRVSATGLVLEGNTDFNVVKKLKLTGEPYKVFKNTAFIKGMFNSDLEVNKALHAKLQTVSGIRGEIKKAEGTEGHFRATFEDRILMSDLVLLKSWVQVSPKQFYNPMLDIAEWRRMKSTGELRFEQSLPAPVKKDSKYGKQLVRTRRKFQKLQLPKAVEANLPFKSVPKQERALKKPAQYANRESRMINKEATAVIRSDYERQQRSLLDRLNVVRKDKVKKNKDAKAVKKAEKQKKEAKIQELRDKHTRDNRKTKHVKAGRAEMKKREKLQL
eukprot:g3945.t1